MHLFLNKRQNTNHSFLPVTSKVSCIQRKQDQIICLQGNHKSMVIFVLKRRSGTNKLFNVKYLPLFHHFKAIYQFPKHKFFGQNRSSLNQILINDKKYKIYNFLM